MTFIDLLTGWPEAFATKDQTAVTAADVFLSGIVCRYGRVSRLHSDPDQTFLSKLFKEVTERVHCQQSFTTGHIMAMCNARVERCRKTLENVIACYITADHTTWPQLLPVALLAVRSTVNGRSQFASYKLLFVSDPPRMGLPLLEVYDNRKSCPSPVCMQRLLMQTTQGVVTHCLPQ